MSNVLLYERSLKGDANSRLSRSFLDDSQYLHHCSSKCGGESELRHEGLLRGLIGSWWDK